MPDAVGIEAKYLDENYQRWCREFGYRPPGKPMLEIFNSARGTPGQQWFSTRMTGMPYLGAVGASTGRIVAMTSPCSVMRICPATLPGGCDKMAL